MVLIITTLYCPHIIHRTWFHRKTTVGAVREAQEVAYSPDFLSKKLLTRLLKNGEREAVIQFLQQTANIRPMERKSLLESAEAIRNGVMPFWYLPMLANL